MNDNPLRLRLLLGKFRIKKIERGLTGFRATIDLGQGVSMIMDCPISADVRLNDILTFYTEVPYDAHTVPPPVQ